MPLINPMNPFDELLDQLGPAAQTPPPGTPPKPPEPEPPPSPLYEKATELMRAGQQATSRDVRRSEVDAQPLTGDKAAEIQRISKKLGVSAVVVEDNLDTYREQERNTQTQAGTLPLNAPKLAAWVAQDKYKLAAVREDLDSMTVLEHTLNAGSGIFGAVEAGAEEFAAGVWGLLQAGAEQLGGPVTAANAWQGGGAVNAFAEFAKSTGEMLRGMQTRAREGRDKLGFVGSNLLGGVESVVSALPSLAVGPAAGATAALSMIGAQTAGSAYGQARQEGVTPGKALGFAALQGVIEVATEKMPVEILLKDVAAKTPLITKLVHQVVPEVAGENVATVLQDLNEWAVLPSNKDRTFSDYLAERPSAAAATTISVIAMLGINTAAAHAASSLIDGLAETAEGSSLLKRDPGQFADLVDHLATDSPTSTLYARAADWITYWQSKGADPKAEALKLTGDPNAYDAAVSTNGDIAIPVGQYAAQLATSEHHEHFSKELRIQPGMPNAREAADAEKQTVELMDAVQQSIEDAATQREQPTATNSPIRSALVAQVLADPGFQAMAQREKVDAQTVANVYAAGVEAVLTNLSTRAGEDPLDVIARHGIRIGEEGVQAAIAAVQRAPQEATTPAGAPQTPDETQSAPGEAPAGAETPAAAPPADEAAPPPPGEATLSQGPAPARPTALALAPAEVQDGRLVLSSRVPTGKDAEAQAAPLRTDATVILDRPKVLKAVAEKLRPMRQVTEREAQTTDADVVESTVQRIMRNLRYLWNHYPTVWRERAKLWYVGAHRIALQFSDKYDITLEQSAGVLAVLSPQMDWFRNVSLAERTIEIYQKAEKDNPTFTRELVDHYVARAEAGLVPYARANIAPSKGQEAADAYVKAKKARLREDRKRLTGRAWSDLFTLDQARLLRAIDETTNSPTYHVILPEGEQGDLARTANGTPAKIGWGTYEFIANAIRVLRDGSVETINDRVGYEHKVRSFFNNISNPWNPNYVTIDTHAVAAALFEPHAGSDTEVKLAMSGPGDAHTGISGTNAVYAEAYFRLADELGVSPRELQSVTWEAVRGLFTASQKKHGADLDKAIRSSWQEVRSGATLDEEVTRDRIVELAGGIARPAWADTPPRVAFDEGRIRRGDVRPGEPGVPAGRRDTGENPTGAPRRRTNLADGAVVPRVEQLARGRTLDAAERTAGATRALDRFRDAKTRVYESRSARRAGKDGHLADGPHTAVVYEANGEFADAFAASGFGVADILELRPTAAAAKFFHQTITAAKGKIADGAQVYIYPRDDYKTMRLFVTPTGNAGFAIKSDGDIVSVFNYNGAASARIGNSMIALAVQLGGTKLDCFDTTLPDVYALNGFRVVRRDPWNEEYKPEGWNKEHFARFKNGEPDVVYMEYDPVSLKSGPVTLYQSPVPAPTTHQWTYSRIQKAVEIAKQEKATGRDWKNIIKGSKLGVNQDEFFLTGVDDLEDGKQYSRQEVLDYLKTNQVAVDYVVLQETWPTAQEIATRADIIFDQELQARLSNADDLHPLEIPWDDVEEVTDPDEPDVTKYSVYDQVFDTKEEAEKHRDAYYEELLTDAENERERDIADNIRRDEIEQLAEEELVGEQDERGLNKPHFEEYTLDRMAFADKDSYREVFVVASSEQRRGFPTLTAEENARFQQNENVSAMPRAQREIRHADVHPDVQAGKPVAERRGEVINRWIQQWEELLPHLKGARRENLARDIDVMKKLQDAGPEKAIWNSEPKWHDGHDEYFNVENPIVRVRFNRRQTQRVITPRRELNQAVMERGIEAARELQELNEQMREAGADVTNEQRLRANALREEHALSIQEMKDAAEQRGFTGERVMFVEEFQAPAKGEENYDAMPELFQKNWREIGLKWALRYAAENNLDGVAWTNGDVQADRYSLRKQVKQIAWREALAPEKVAKGLGRSDPAQKVDIALRRTTGEKTLTLFVDGHGEVVVSEDWENAVGQSLADVVGAQLAKQIMTESSGTIADEGLEVGGRGLARLYDTDLVNIANKLPAMKSAGVKVGSTYVQTRSESKAHPFIPMTPELKAAVLGGQALFQEDSGAKRGSITLAPGAIRIQLLKDADLSTFLHETGHLYLHVMDDLVSKIRKGDPVSWSASQKSLIADYDTVTKWLGSTPGEGFTVDQHEQFARGFEAYLMGGKAPVPEMNSAFSRFRQWLTKIYRTMTTLGVNLNPEVVGVFDRLVAGEDAIEKAKASARFTPIFSTPEQAGMGPIEWQGYQKILQTAHAQAQDAMATRVAGELARERTAWWKARRKELTEEITKQYANSPVYRALTFLQKGETPDGQPVDGAMKLSKDAIVEKYGAERLKTLPRPYVYQADGGLDPDTAAQLLGFTSGDELLTQITQADKIADVVKRDVDGRMKQDYGNMQIDGTLRMVAQQSVEENGFEQVLEAELKAIARAARQARPIVTAAKAQVQAEDDSARRAMRRALTAAAVPTSVLHENAAKTIGRIAPKDIKPNLYWQAAQREAAAASRAFAAGRYEDAVAAKSKQRVAVALHREAVNSLQEADAIEKYASRMAETPAQARLGKAGESYQSQVNALLNKFEFADVTNKALERRKSLNEWVAERQKEGLPIDLPADVLEAANKQNYRTAPMDTLREVRDAIKQIENLARLKNNLLATSKKRDYDTARDGLVANILAKNPVRKGELEFRRTDERKHTVADWFGSMKKIAELAAQLDGYVDGGPMWDLVIRPLNDAADREVTRREKEGAKYDAILKKHYPGAALGEWSQKRHIPALNASLSKEAILSVALNWGNETSRDRLLSDPKRRWDRRQIEAILDQLDERDWRFVQDTWDYIDTFWSEISDKQFRLTGIRPDKVAPSFVDTKYGRQRGGYYPLKYDSRLAPSPGINNLVTDAKQSLQAAYLRATTKRGHTKTRLDHVELPVRLDVGVMFEHLDQVIHDLTHHEALIDVSRLLRDGKVAGAIHDVGGDVMFRQFTNSLTDIALGKRPGGNVMDRAANYMKTGTQVAALGFNLWTAAQQPLGLFNGAARVGPTWVARGMFRWMRDAATMENTMKWIADVSPFMASRSLTANPDIADLRNKLSEPGGWFDALVRKVSSDKITQQNITDSFLWHIGLMQRVADVPTWLGAYEKAKAGGKSDGDAVALADQAVRDSQGSGQIVDLSQVQRGGPIARLFMTFYSYGNTVYNATSRAAGETQFKSPTSVARFLGNMGLLYFFPALGAVVLGRLFGMGGGGDDDDDLAKWTKDVAAEMGASALNTMVFVRELGGLMRSGNRGYQGPAGTRLLQQVYQLGAQVQQGEVDGGLLKAMNSVAGVLFRYPAVQAQRMVDGFAALESGETENPMALLFGPPKKEK